MSYVDKSVRDIFNKTALLRRNTYIIIYGDHPPGIKNRTYSDATYQYNGRQFQFVPLFIITPDDKTYKESQTVVTEKDVAPTVLSNADIPFDILTEGDDLLKVGKLTKNNIVYYNQNYDRKLLFRWINNDN